MTLAIFDLDNTLIGGDSDNLWGQFLCEEQLVETADYAQRNDQFYADYQAGQLDIDAYLRFALSALKGHSPRQLEDWHLAFMASKITPIMLPKAAALIDDHRQRGHELLVITATNRFITEPIVQSLGIQNLIASEGEIIDGRYTGEPSGVPSYHRGKVTRLYEWLHKRQASLDGAWFYSDSRNDLPLLELIDHPVAVDPDDVLRARAIELEWPVISLR